MPSNAYDVKRALLAKGFAEQPVKGHHAFVYVRRDGLRSRFRTLMSRNDQEVSDGLLGQMARQVGLTSPQFKALVSCTFTRDDFEAAHGFGSAPTAPEPGAATLAERGGRGKLGHRKAGRR